MMLVTNAPLISIMKGKQLINFMTFRILRTSMHTAYIYIDSLFLSKGRFSSLVSRNLGVGSDHK